MELTLGTIFLFFLFLALATFALGGILAAPWVPLKKSDIMRMLKLAEVKPGEIVYDLGAGDGRIIIIAADEFKANATGFELAILPYLVGLIKIILRGLGGKAVLKYRNFYYQDLGQADVVCAFLAPKAMIKLKPKLEKEIKPGGRIVSAVFSIPDWQPKKIDKPNKKAFAIYLYQK